MISRRQLLAAGVAAGAAGAFSVSSVWAATPVEGKDYLVVRPPLDLRSQKIVVHDFFAYICPHCLTFAPYMEKFAEQVKSMPDVQFVPVPISWTDDTSAFSRAYFSFVALNRMDLSMPFWEWVIKGEHTWKTPSDIDKEISDWIVKNSNGVTAATWKSVMTSFGVVTKYRTSTQIWQSYGVDSTPTVGIDGKYMTAPHLTGTRERTIDAILYLIDKVRKERAA